MLPVWRGRRLSAVVRTEAKVTASADYPASWGCADAASAPERKIMCAYLAADRA